jgi:hypothetical protein
MTPLHRSRSFWFGLAGLVLLAGMWVSSMYQCWFCSAGLRSGFAAVLGHAPGGVCVFGFCYDGEIEPSLSFEPQSMPSDARWFPSAEVEINTRKLYLVIPHWLLVAVMLSAWIALLWRRRLWQRKLAAGAMARE